MQFTHLTLPSWAFTRGPSRGNPSKSPSVILFTHNRPVTLEITIRWNIKYKKLHFFQGSKNLSIWYKFKFNTLSRSWEKGSWKTDMSICQTDDRQTYRQPDGRTSMWSYKGHWFLLRYGILKTTYQPTYDYWIVISSVTDLEVNEMNGGPNRWFQR